MYFDIRKSWINLIKVFKVNRLPDFFFFFSVFIAWLQNAGLVSNFLAVPKPFVCAQLFNCCFLGSCGSCMKAYSYEGNYFVLFSSGAGKISHIRMLWKILPLDLLFPCDRLIALAFCQLDAAISAVKT